MVSTSWLWRTFYRLILVAGACLIAFSLLTIGQTSLLARESQDSDAAAADGPVNAIDRSGQAAAVEAANSLPVVMGAVVAQQDAVAATQAAAVATTSSTKEQQQRQKADEALDGYDVNLAQKQRKAAIEGICRQRKELKRSTPWQYKFDPRHNMLYCPVPKSGWSSWKRVFFYVNGAIKSMEVEIGITPDKNASMVEMTGFAVIRRNVSGTFRPYTFMFVRDPWQRLLSAYINKALDWNYTRILHTPCDWETMKPYRQPITFTQFLTCIVDRDGSGRRLDIHWTPMWKLCDMCQIHYNAIGHMETMAADARHVLASNKLDLAFPVVFSSRAHKPADVAHSWYKTVPATVLRRLQKLYELDFLLNSYSNVPPGWEGKL